MNGERPIIIKETAVWVALTLLQGFGLFALVWAVIIAVIIFT